MTRKTGILAAVLLLLGVAGIGVYRALRPDHRKDLELTITALHEARSWHEEFDGPGNVAGSWVHRVSDAVCPVGKLVVADETDAGSHLTHAEFFYTQRNGYYHQPTGWQKWGSPWALECTSGPSLDGLGIRLQLEDVLHGAIVRPGEVRTVGTEPCRDYEVKSIWREFTICVNAADHLPREIVSSFFKDETGRPVNPERATYSRWNRVDASELPAGVPFD